MIVSPHYSRGGVYLRLTPEQYRALRRADGGTLRTLELPTMLGLDSMCSKEGVMRMGDYFDKWEVGHPQWFVMNDGKATFPHMTQLVEAIRDEDGNDVLKLAHSDVKIAKLSRSHQSFSFCLTYSWHCIRVECRIREAGDFDQEKYLLNLALHGRKGRTVFEYNLLQDVRDNTQPSESQFTREKHAQVALTLQEAVEKMRRPL